jgi:flagellum-specific peptidoglycan hydrolase FlgJ
VLLAGLAISALQPLTAQAITPREEVARAAQERAAADAAAKADQAHIDQLERQLQDVQNQLAQLQAKLAELGRQIDASQARISELTARIDAHKKQEDELSAQLARIARLNYERQGSFLAEVLRSGDLVHLWGNISRATIVARQERTLRDKVEELRRQDTAAREEVGRTLVELSGQKEQAAAVATLAGQRAEALTRNREQVKLKLRTDTSASQQAAQREAAALAMRGVIYQAVPGGVFSVDTDLRIVPKVDPWVLNAFLAKTALAGLGPSFVSAGTQNHVNPLYLLAHAIEESAFGTSFLAQSKHNLFGYGAIDSDPNQARSFPSFDAAVQFQAKVVSDNYLSPQGQFFHGPTLRGMNVCYASDPDWAGKIATIYRTLPGGADPVPTS